MLCRYVAYDKQGVARLFTQDKDAGKAYSDIRDYMKQFIKKFPQCGNITHWVIRLEHPE